jgi:hypothetical protein
MAGYLSDYDQFLKEMRAKHPEWADEQRQGLARLWDRKLDRDEQKAFGDAAVKPKPYPYDTNFF